MAYKLGDAFIEFTAKDGPFRKATAQIGGQLRKLGKSMQGVSRAARNMLLVGGGAFAGFTKLYATQEHAEKMLDSALRANGASVEKYGKQLRQLASRMQEVTTYGDEFILQMMTAGLNLGITADKIGDVTKMAIGMSKVLRMDLNSAMRYTVLALQGEFTMLNRYLPALRATTDDTEKLRIVQEAAAKGWRQAQDETKTLTGALKQTKHVLGDLGEILGGTFARKIKEFAVDIRVGAKAAGELVKQNKDLVIQLSELAAGILAAVYVGPKLIGMFASVFAATSLLHPAITLLAAAVLALGAAYVSTQAKGETFAEKTKGSLGGLQNIAKVINYGWKGIKTGVLAVATGVESTAKMILDAWEPVPGVFGKATNALQVHMNIMWQEIKDMWSGTEKGGESTFDAIGRMVDNFKLKFKDAMRDAKAGAAATKDELAKLGKEFDKQFRTMVEARANAMRSTGKSLADWKRQYLGGAAEQIKPMRIQARPMIVGLEEIWRGLATATGPNAEELKVMRDQLRKQEMLALQGKDQVQLLNEIRDLQYAMLTRGTGAPIAQ